MQYKPLFSFILDGVVKKVTADCQSAYCQEKKANYDGIVCCLHTEGSADVPGNNRDKYLRTLGGFFIHPNVGAGVAVYNEE